MSACRSQRISAASNYEHSCRNQSGNRPLTLGERAEVARCLHEWEDDAWDEQMRRDLADGKLDRLLAKVDTDIEAGKLRDLP